LTVYGSSSQYRKKGFGMRQIAVPLIAIIGAALASSGARAVPPGYHLRLEAGTDFPAAVGARLSAELPYRLRVGTSLGVLPGPYVDTINAIVVGLDAYPQTTADLIRAALENSLIWRLQAGWRPFDARGLYIDLGYSLVTLGGGATGDQIIAAATGNSPPSSSRGREYDIRSTLHMLIVEIGWEWSLWRDRLSLRAAIGGAFTVGASTAIDPVFATSGPAEARLVQAFTGFGEGYLDDTYTSYVHTPVISVAAGYRFF
jgi:hypothetical protein